MNKRLLLAVFVYSVFSSGVALCDCNLQWNTDLKTDIIGPKGGYGDTNTAYAYFSFKSDPSTVYRIKGKFPHVRYMSLETNKRLDNLGVGTWDVDGIQDHAIIPDSGSEKPFLPGVDKDVASRDYTVHAVPAGIQYNGNDATNIINVATDTSRGSIWLRMVAPNEGYTISDPTDPEQQKKLPLPTIEALDLSGNKITCQQGLTASNGITSTVKAQAIIPSVDLEGILKPLVGAVTPEKFWKFPFSVISMPFEGNSGIPGYSYGMTKMTIGNVALVKFKAPSFTNTFPDSYTIFNPVEDLRYWSLCSLNLYTAKGLACMADYQLHVDKYGFVTIAYGLSKDVKVMTKAQAKGYNFLPDTRTAEQEQDILAFVLRQILPSKWFTITGLHKGDYVPQARICRRTAFLSGLCTL
jgi:hypothetical protein